MDRLRRMEIFVKVVQSGGFTRAAKQLSVSKSTVSQAVTDLELYLGLQLINRNSRSLQLTDVGQDYYENCLRVLSDIHEMEDTVRGEATRVAGQICITAPPSFGAYALTPIVSRFMGENPGVTIKMHLTEENVDLISEGIDIAFRMGPLKDSRLLARKIGEANMVVCAASSYLDARGRPEHPDELVHHDCLTYTRLPIWHLHRGEEMHSIDPDGSVETNSGESLLEFTLKGWGIAQMPDIVVRKPLKAGKLETVLTDYKGQKLDFYLVRPPARHCPLRVKRFIDFFVADQKTKKWF